MKANGRGGVLGVAATIFICAASTIAKTSAQTAAVPPTSPAEMAKVIARSIDANTSKTSIGPMHFESVTAHDNVVEMKYATKDATFFARSKTNLDGTRLALSHKFCDVSDVSFLSFGITLHVIMLAPDNHDRIDITVDQGSCAPADAETLARRAEAIAAQETADEKASPADGLIQFDVAKAHNSVVEFHSIVADARTGQNMKANPELTAKVMVEGMNRYFCDKYSDDIAEGLSIHEMLTLADGSPVIDFTIDRSSCAP